MTDFLIPTAITVVSVVILLGLIFLAVLWSMNEGDY